MLMTIINSNLVGATLAGIEKKIFEIKFDSFFVIENFNWKLTQELHPWRFMVKKFLNQLHFECIIKLNQLRVSLSIKQKFIVPWYYYYWKFHFLKKFLRRDMQMKLMNRLWFLEFLFQFSFFLSFAFS